MRLFKRSYGSVTRVPQNKKWLRIGFFVLTVLILFRIALPYITLNFINGRLAKINGYYGHVADLDVVGPEDKKDSVLRKIWESLVVVVGDLVENKRIEQIATKIPIAGE